ncbi:TM2 domain-containing membrane protein YozV [Bacillus fengqiuensis]|nr:TM2 domain-containing membrane protein YozV [Bacillus fengqiuensis]
MMMNNCCRHPIARISVFGITHLQWQNPYMVAWWSATFPGFGHFLLNQYIRGMLLTLSEVITNTLAHINEAMVYSFCGKFELAKSVIEPKWTYGYLIIYLLAIGDSYRSALSQNKMCQLAELENGAIQSIKISPSEIQYLERKSPAVGALYSFFFPGLGQLYNHRFGLAFYAMFWWWTYLALSNVHESLLNLLLGRMDESISMLHPHWLLFMPSVMGGSIFHAYVTAVEHNRLFCLEQRQHLANRYRNSKVRIFP